MKKYHSLPLPASLGLPWDHATHLGPSSTIIILWNSLHISHPRGGKRGKVEGRKLGSHENKTASTSRPTRLVSSTNPGHPGSAWSLDVRKASSGWDGSALRYLRQTRRIGQLFSMGTRALVQPEPVNISSRGPSCATSRSEATGEKTSLFGKGFLVKNA